MSTYKTTRCGSCGTAWKFMERNPISIMLGPPKVKCRNCHSINSTDLTLPRDITPSQYQKLQRQVVAIYLRVIISAIIYAPVMVGSFYLALDFVQDDKMVFLGKLLFGLGFTSLGLYLLYNLWQTIIFYKEVFAANLIQTALDGNKWVEELYDKNSGFLWSDEWYK